MNRVDEGIIRASTLASEGERMLKAAMEALSPLPIAGSDGEIALTIAAIGTDAIGKIEDLNRLLDELGAKALRKG